MTARRGAKGAGTGKRAAQGAKTPVRGSQGAQGGVTGPDLSYLAPDLRGMAVALADLRPADRNARRHRADRDIPVLMESLSRFGQRKPVVARPGGEVIAGNGTLAAARALGWSHLAVSWFHGTDQEAMEYALVDNRSAELSEWDLEELSGQLREIHEREGSRPGALGWDAAALGPLLAAQWQPPALEPLPGPDAEASGDAPSMITMSMTEEQHAIIMQAVAKVREQEGDAGLSEGRCLELIAADYLDGI